MNNGKHSKKESRWVKFGRWVRTARLQIIDPMTRQPITHGEAAKRAGLSRVHWTRIEAGDTGIKATTVPLIARALGYTTEDEVNEVFKKAGFAVEEEAFELPRSMRHFAQLPEEIQRDIAIQVERYYEYEQAKAKKRGAE